ncbi:hypothetical protein A2716_02145 [candidate division WWE3 bacterium RIFCSPHIGHO2_01_FULL_40_23]|uniref:Ribosomal subunit interface protein n=1 Tax=candidate division WWE3 bacterium RIFCSPLOWO2_01_FULL_41_18 TaxID=1802625 RepID=A0A1F4VFT3_UNCKA|nr:MAG: hypothetical protein A2716_02145 [candidate division WWE3 bacterium RIFCSPHIGHO2_01_FULL_40_23]OGC55788.1 MAG: hypothetical protein A3A78_01995 [candidate division WWE3 bacterium RIFCSPLOWO2_01_FULL_41_18]
MPYQIATSNLDLPEASRELVLEKLSKIEKFVRDVGEELVDIRAVLEKGPRFGFRAKVEVWAGGRSFVATGAGISFEGTIDDAVEEIIRQITKHKGKAYGKNKEMLRKLKRFVFFFGEGE